MVDESEEMIKVQKIPENNDNKCKFCNKCSQKQYLKECKHCKEIFHLICAFINGCSIEISEWKNNFEIKLEIKCCSAKGEDGPEF
jgi:hypothetical protein